MWGNLTVNNSSFSGNQAKRPGNATGGGAISIIAKDSVVTINGSTFINNTTTLGFAKGGAIVTDGTLTIVNSTFYKNSADSRGGAIAVEFGSVTLTHVTLSENISGENGAGIYVAGTLILQNTIIANNTIGGNCFIQDGSIIDGRGNLRYPLSDESCVGTYGNPQLLPPAANGGITQTMALGWDSAAIDRIDSANGCGVGVNDDQRGISRPQPHGWLCDIGAYERVRNPVEVDIRCFIATAAYGSSQENHVATLRLFRDEFLLTNSLGRTFVQWYYSNSPEWAAHIARHDWLRAFVRFALTPAYLLAAIAINGYLPATLLILVIVFLTFTGKRKFANSRNKIF